MTETLNTNVLVLLIEDDPAGVEPIREALAHRAGWSRLQCVGSVATGIARIAGGGVSVVLLNLSKPRGDGDDGLSHFRRLHAGAPGVPIVVLCRAEEESLALSAVRAGAADYMIRDRCATDLERVVQSVLERHRRSLESTPVETASGRKAGATITLLGAKGGVGTTTLALNVGCVLARRNKAIVAELRSTLGTLSPFFGPQSRTRNITGLLNVKPAELAETQAASSLWPCRTIPGLNLLFGPQTVEPCPELGQAHAKAILALLAERADFVVVDLPPVLSEANRAVIQASSLLALVIERDPICLHAAKMMLQADRIVERCTADRRDPCESCAGELVRLHRRNRNSTGTPDLGGDSAGAGCVSRRAERTHSAGGLCFRKSGGGQHYRVGGKAG